MMEQRSSTQALAAGWDDNDRQPRKRSDHREPREQGRGVGRFFAAALVSVVGWDVHQSMGRPLSVVCFNDYVSFWPRDAARCDRAVIGAGLFAPPVPVAAHEPIGRSSTSPLVARVLNGRAVILLPDHLPGLMRVARAGR